MRTSFKTEFSLVIEILFYFLVTWLGLFSVYIGASSFYFLHMRRCASKEWTLQLEYGKKPTVTILVPTYNEERVIGMKLENLSRINYPKDRMKILIVDGASEDNTLKEVKRFTDSHPQMKLEILREEKRCGKSHALNHALKYAKSDVIVVSDADCYWLPDIFTYAFAYLADPTVGAVAGQEKLLNPDDSWVTKTEAAYRDQMFLVQLGESKLHSTIQFEGGFGAYKSDILDEFDYETGSDDSGTALNIVQKNARTIVVPEATFYTNFPTRWQEKFNIKVRRAQQLLRIWLKCLKLLARGKLVLPKRIVLLEAFLSFFGPFIFLGLIIVSMAILTYLPYLLLPFAVALVVPRVRIYLAEIAQTNLALLAALSSLVTKRESVMWTISESSRNVKRSILKEKGLI